MANYNRVILMGNLTRDPQVTYLPSQTPVAEFGLAVNRRWRGQNNEQREETCFVDCRAYGPQAETIGKYMSKGRPILVEGRLQFDQWEGKDGTRRSKHRVIVDRFQFVGGQGGPGGGGGGGSYAPAQQRPASRPAPAREAPQAPEAPEPEDEGEPPSSYDDVGGDEIPF